MVAEYDLRVCSVLERRKVMREIELVENVRVAIVREEILAFQIKFHSC